MNRVTLAPCRGVRGRQSHGPQEEKNGVRFGSQCIVSYSFKQTSNSASFFVLQNVWKSKKKERKQTKKPPVSCYLLSMGTKTFMYKNVSRTDIRSVYLNKPCCERRRWADRLHKPAPWHFWCHVSEYTRRNLENFHQAAHTCVQKHRFTSCCRANVVISILIITLSTILLIVNISHLSNFAECGIFKKANRTCFYVVPFKNDKHLHTSIKHLLYFVCATLLQKSISLIFYRKLLQWLR